MAGALVWAEDPKIGERGLKRVVRTFLNESDELVHIKVNGETITCTPEHPFYVHGAGWVAAKDLKPDYRLVLKNGMCAVVETIRLEKLAGSISVYNFEVEGFHTYYVGTCRVLVHNECKGNWASGSNGSPNANLTKHFNKHGYEVGASTPAQYTLKATNYANTVLAKRGIRTAHIGGYTYGVTRYYYNGKYVDLVFDGKEHLLVSYGKQ